MTVHRVRPARDTVHGTFDRGHDPILTIDSGDTVIYETLDAGWSRLAAPNGERGLGFEARVEDQIGHALCGPIAIRGARPGDTLEVAIGPIRPGPWGFTWAGPRPEMRHYDLGIDDETTLIWSIDPDSGTAKTRQDPHITVEVRPFMGVLGNAPPEPGPHSTTPPRAVGGNIDCRELVTGSTLWLPIAVEGALFSVGDGHAAQADGEAGQTAIECPMDRVELTFTVRRDMSLTMPEATTPAGYVTFGFADSLHAATNIALNRMLDYLQGTCRLTRPEALALASLVVHLRITQIVNSISGVHALLPHHAFMLDHEPDS